MSIVGFFDYTKAANDQLRSASNTEPLPVTTGSGALAARVQGNSAAGVADVGDPVKIGGVFNTIQPTYANGQRGDVQLTSKGAVWTTLQAATGIGIFTGTGTDTQSNGATTLFVSNYNYAYNSSNTWDRIRTLSGAANTTGTGVQAADFPLLSTSDLLSTPFTFAAAGDNTIIAGVAGQTIRVHRIVISTAAATQLTVKDGAGTALTGAMHFGTDNRFILDMTTGRPWFKTSAGNNLVLNSTVAVQVTGFVQYVQSA